VSERVERRTGVPVRGFTLIEVMFALALMGLGLVVLIKSAAGSVFNAEQAHMLGVATARSSNRSQIILRRARSRRRSATR